MKVYFVSPEGEVYNGEADLVIAPAGDGQIGIMQGHQPILTSLKSGDIKIKTANDEKIVAVTGGFLSVYDNDIEIAADLS
jgi:F-type H+-transporting ATPase subunit epsilon